MQSFEEQRVLVVGGTSGIGLAAAEAFAVRGAKVTVASRSQDNVVRAIAQIGRGCAGQSLDSRDSGAVTAFAAASGVWDHVVISAARTPTGPVRVLEDAQAREAMDSKFWGAYFLAKNLKISPSGSLTFISGFLANRPNKMSVLQGAINSALESLGRGLAVELAPTRVNTVSPGLVETPLWNSLPQDRRDMIFKATVSQLPAGRIGQPEDVANAIIYLAATGFATGSTVLVDGGGTIA
jgi:NAD(P)-dependent dehydrogenase (short-subunit alcohol dehydrogenase family)